MTTAAKPHKRSRRTQTLILLATAVLWSTCGGGTIHGGDTSDAAGADGSSMDGSSTDGASTDGAPSMDANTSLTDAATQTDASPPDGGCLPTNCATLGHECGQWDDGCSSTLDCGPCSAPETCQNGTCEGPAVDCSGIDNHPTFELCDSGPDYCAGVFTNGEGCGTFCAAAGLLCSARYGGDTGCVQEPQNVLSCGDNNGHLSDWCECQGSNPNPTCPGDPTDPPTYQSLHYNFATWFNRSAWVLTCYDYAYTAQFAEHEVCDGLYSAGSGMGSAIFTFTVGPGEYDVHIEGRHTANRNPAGALVEVTSAGQTYTAYINQRDSSGAVQLDLHGRYCLDGTVTVVMDSTVSNASDSIRRVVLTPVP